MTLKVAHEIACEEFAADVRERYDTQADPYSDVGLIERMAESIFATAKRVHGLIREMDHREIDTTAWAIADAMVEACEPVMTLKQHRVLSTAVALEANRDAAFIHAASIVAGSPVEPPFACGPSTTGVDDQLAEEPAQ